MKIYVCYVVCTCAYNVLCVNLQLVIQKRRTLKDMMQFIMKWEKFARYVLQQFYRV